MRLVLRTTNKNIIPERVFIGKNEDFRREMFKIINGYTQNQYKIKWLNDCIVFRKDDEAICLYIFDYKDKVFSLKKEYYISPIF